MRNYTFKPHICLWQHTKNHIHRATHYGETALQKLKILSFLVLFISKIKIADIFNFPSVKYLDKRLSFLKIWHMWVNYCWKYGPSNLLFRFIGHSLQQLNNRQKKIAVNSLIHFFESYYWKEGLAKVSGFLTHWP